MMLSPERGTILRWKYDYKLEVYKGVATTTNLVFKSSLQTTGQTQPQYLDILKVRKIKKMRVFLRYYTYACICISCFLLVCF